MVVELDKKLKTLTLISFRVVTALSCVLTVEPIRTSEFQVLDTGEYQ